MKYWIVIYLVPERVYLAVHAEVLQWLQWVAGPPAPVTHGQASAPAAAHVVATRHPGATEAAHGFSVTGLERGVSVLLADAGLGVVEWRADRRKLHASKRRMTHPGRFHDFKKEVR